MSKGNLVDKNLIGNNSRVSYFQVDGLNQKLKLELAKMLTLELGLKVFSSLTGRESEVSLGLMIEHYSNQDKKIDFLYLNIAVLKNFHPKVISKILQFLSRKGIICVEYMDEDESIDINMLLEMGFELASDALGLLIFTRIEGDRPLRSIRYLIDIYLRRLQFQNSSLINNVGADSIPEVAVIVLTYKHEAYIAQCIRSILNQRGDFTLKLIVIDDASPDATAKIIQSLIANLDDDRVSIKFQINSKNLGVVNNLARANELAIGSDYITFCEGDDYWCSDLRIQKHIDFLGQHLDCVMSFNCLEFCDSKGGNREIFQTHLALDKTEFIGSELASNNFIGNFSACFYRGKLMEIIPYDIYKIYTVDWFFNLYCSQFGKIGYLDERLSVYRQHSGGEWSSRTSLEKTRELLKLIGEYDEFLDYQFNEAFQKYITQLYGTVEHLYGGKEGRLELLVIDDVFPSTRSGFRYVEFTHYLESFPNSLVATSGLSLGVLEDSSIDEVIRQYQRKNHALGSRVVQYTDSLPISLANLIYVNFLTNIYRLLPKIEAAKTPFVFTLYPGAGFVLNDVECDRKLKRVFDSPFFEKVIVTQKITNDYIVDRRLCDPQKIKMIFGVVMPEINSPSLILSKSRWGIDKTRLDICFMAHKYTRYGEDKGYDVFVNVAKILRDRHDDIYFHVVGPFDRLVIDVSPFKDRIKFYGSLDPDEFNDFFSKMDLILSPNISGKIAPGSFDGFPTASCTEAGLRSVAIFAVDEFNSAQGHFTNGKDIVLLKYDIEDILEKIEYYYTHPLALKELGECTRDRICQLYSLEMQMGPRITLLKELIERKNTQLDGVMKDAESIEVETVIIEAELMRCSGATLNSKYSVLNGFMKLVRRTLGDCG